jgi:hypothetical protein
VAVKEHVKKLVYEELERIGPKVELIEICEFDNKEKRRYEKMSETKKGETNNTLAGLNEYLFEALDALTNTDLTPEQLELEIAKSSAVTKVAQTIINNANVMLEATKLANAPLKIDDSRNNALKLLS